MSEVTPAANTNAKNEPVNISNEQIGPQDSKDMSSFASVLQDLGSNSFIEKQPNIDELNQNTSEETEKIVVNTETEPDKADETIAVIDSREARHLQNTEINVNSSHPNQSDETNRKPDETNIIKNKPFKNTNHSNNNPIESISAKQELVNLNNNASEKLQSPQSNHEASLKLPTTDIKWAKTFSQSLILFIGKNVQSAKINIYPPELGNISVQLKIEGNQVDINLTLQNHAVKQAVDAALPVLRQSLQAENLQLTHMNVELANKEQSSDSSHREKNAPQNQSNNSSQPNKQETQKIVKDETKLINIYV